MANRPNDYGGGGKRNRENLYALIREIWKNARYKFSYTYAYCSVWDIEIKNS